MKRSLSSTLGTGSWLAYLSLALALLSGCSDDKSTNSGGSSSGKITAIATGIDSQNGNVYSVLAYAYDWSPGATTPAVAGTRELISVADFSSTAVLDSLDAGGVPTTTHKTLEPGTYSVVFVVSLPGNPPQRYAEVRIAVNGDNTAYAPDWGEWIRS